MDSSAACGFIIRKRSGDIVVMGAISIHSSYSIFSR